MADYLLIPDFTGFTVNVEDTTNVSGGYALSTPFYLEASFIYGTSPAAILNGCKIFWHYGDGTSSQTTEIQDNSIRSDVHYYNWPGTYEVKLSVISNDGLSAVTFNKTIAVSSFVNDSLNWVYSGWTDLSANNLAAGAVFHGFQSCYPGDLNASLPLTIQFTASTTLSDLISFNLYSYNSNSQPWNIATIDNKYANLRPRWRFTDLSGNALDTLLPDSTQLTPIYADAQGRPASSSFFDDTTSVLVGYSGSIDFYYIDDIPSLSYSSNTSSFSVNTPVLQIVSNTTTRQNYQDKNDGLNPSFSNSVVAVSSKFYVKNLSATHFNITLNGGNILLPNTLWPSVTGAFIVTVNSELSSTGVDAAYSNKNLLNYPIPYSNSSVIINNTPAGSTTVQASSFNFSRTDSIGRDTGGFYKNILITPDITSPLLSSGVLSSTMLVSASNITILVEPPPNALSGYNPDTRAQAASSYNSLQVISLTGAVSYNIIDFNKVYFVRKINENFNYGAQLYNYALQPTIANNQNFFAMLSAMAGDSYTYDENFGTVIYEKISNFVANTQDVQTSNVNNLYSLADSIDNQFDNYDLTPPPALKRAFDLYSVSHNRLWGTREKYNINFNNAAYHTNLGNSLTAYNINTTIVSAGQKIVLNDKFISDYYELIEVPTINSYASVTAANMQGYFTPSMSYPLTSYPLSAFFGWGVKTPVADYYRFWVYVDFYNNIPTNNLIDWNTRTDGLSTTLSESVSSITEWYKDGGILENIYSYYLYKGLDLL